MLTEIDDKKRYQAVWQKAGACFIQSWMWGEVKRPAEQPLRLILDDKYPLQVLIRSLPGIGRFGYAPRATRQLFTSPTLLAQACRQICIEQRLAHVTFDPDTYDSEAFQEDSWRSEGFHTHAKTIQPRYSRLLDLKRSDEELVADMKKDVRRRHRRAGEAGVDLEEDTTQKGFDQFYDCLHGVSQRVGFHIHPKSYYLSVFKQFSTENMAHIYMAKKDGVLLYALLALSDNGIFRRLYGGPSLEGRASNAAQFVAIEVLSFARRLGCHSLDLWGIAPPSDPKHALASVTRFKNSLGGEIAEYWPQLIWVRSAVHYRAYKTLLNIRSKLSLNLP